MIWRCIQFDRWKNTWFAYISITSEIGHINLSARTIERLLAGWLAGGGYNTIEWEQNGTNYMLHLNVDKYHRDHVALFCGLAWSECIQDRSPLLRGWWWLVCCCYTATLWYYFIIQPGAMTMTPPAQPLLQHIQRDANWTKPGKALIIIWNPIKLGYCPMPR